MCALKKRQMAMLPINDPEITIDGFDVIRIRLLVSCCMGTRRRDLAFFRLFSYIVFMAH